MIYAKIVDLTVMYNFMIGKLFFVWGRLEDQIFVFKFFDYQIQN